MSTFYQDVRYSLRMMCKNAGFTLIAMITLGLGLGANTAIYSVVQAVLLNPLSYSQPERLVQLWRTNPKATRWGDWASFPDYEDWRRRNRSFEDVAAYRSFGWNITGGDVPETMRGAFVTPNLFPVLGVQPMIGRGFLPEEDAPGRSRVVIFSHSFWQRRFGGDRSLVGKSVTIDGEIHVLIGVMPQGFDLPSNYRNSRRSDCWVPVGAFPEREDRGSYNTRVIGRLKPGVTQAQAQADMDAVAYGLAEEHGGDPQMGAAVAAIDRNIVAEVRPSLLLLLGAVGFVLLIACANVANLQLARATTRQKESAIRQALGASRARLIRQYLTESLLLSLVGGAAGLVLALWSVEFLTRIGPDFPRSQEISIDLRVTLFTFGLSVLTGVLSGLAPALASSGGDLHQALKSAGRTAGSGAEGGRMRNGLVVAETALACLLLIGAGLLIQSFFRLGRVDPGFNPRGVLTAYVMLPRATYKEPGRQAAFFKTVIERIEAIPGVEAAGASAAVPLTQTHHSGSFLVEGQPPHRPGEPIIQAEHPPVTPDYFRVIGLPLLRGRVIKETDDENSPAVAVVSETLARLYWPDKDPLGKRVSIENRDGQPVWREIVGVVGAVRHDGLAAESRPVIYVPQLQSPTSFMMLTVRTRTEPADFAPALRQAVASVDRDQPIIEVKTMERYIDDSLAQPRFQTRMLAIFAAVALVLAAIGIYGVMAYSVGQRTHEIGVRMALGARAGDVVKMVLWRGAGMALSGAGIGLLIAIGMARWMSKMLFGVSAYDPLTFVTVAGLLVAVALVACWLPARRAAHVDPMVALRRD